MQSGNDSNKELLLNKVADMHAHGSSWQDIEIELLKQGHPDAMVTEVISLVKKEVHQKNLKAGRAYILSGCIVMVFGFVLTCIKFHANESVNVVMYGFTTLGICILFVGLYKIFD